MSDFNTKEAILGLSTIDPEMSMLLENELPPNDAPRSVEQMRQDMADYETQRYEAGPTFDIPESVMTIPMRDEHESEIRVFRPAAPQASGSPLVVLVFGGGFITGSNLQMVPFARIAAALYGATAVTLSYRRAPEYRFPSAPNDVWDSLNWLAAHAPSLGADPSAGFLLGGISAGGALAVVTAQRAVEEKLSPPLTGLWACIPITLEDNLVPDKYRHMWHSRTQNATAPLLDEKGIEHIRSVYKPDIASADYSPFNSKLGFSELPRTYVQVCGLDPLRDDGLIYERALRDQGVQTKLDVYPGVPHAHFVAFPQLTQSEKYRKDTMAGMGWLLGRQPEGELLKKITAAESADPIAKRF